MEQPATTSAQATATACLDDIRPSLSAWTRTIFDFGETAWREYRSAAWYVERLKREGFS
ncbi:MAG: amidohydrolase, partial [Mesorhizobium sp.]